jgi:hypothetical protein
MLSPENRGRQLAEIRLILADAAPTFCARIARIAPGESDPRP